MINTATSYALLTLSYMDGRVRAARTAGVPTLPKLVLERVVSSAPLRAYGNGQARHRSSLLQWPCTCSNWKELQRRDRWNLKSYVLKEWYVSVTLKLQHFLTFKNVTTESYSKRQNNRGCERNRDDVLLALSIPLCTGIKRTLSINLSSNLKYLSCP
jgi:hypothetical protein